MEPLLTIAGAVVAIGGATVLLGKAGRWLWRRSRQLGHLLDDVLGEPERNGQPARPSLMARVAGIEDRVAVIEKRSAVIEHEVKPNGGNSLKDQVTRIDRALEPDPPF
ncbi:hypothetical protein HCJ94_17230 [Micromonospora sp. HSS6-12]|uniref:Uncharacterized protein n=1 Tax=Micromonospora thermarum TaxID=2720024 RepID=A0ABX0ZBL6_9ACTN|nr:hypothetical protein [Micromonospora thermarum]NJP33676.1 hypothetical protein [Micromonospora thermarum]